MNFERKELIDKPDRIIGLIKTLETAYEEEREQVSFEDIDKLAHLMEELLNDARNYVINAD